MIIKRDTSPLRYNGKLVMLSDPTPCECRPGMCAGMLTTSPSKQYRNVPLINMTCTPLLVHTIQSLLHADCTTSSHCNEPMHNSSHNSLQYLTRCNQHNEVVIINKEKALFLHTCSQSELNTVKRGKSHWRRHTIHTSTHTGALMNTFPYK